MRYRVLPLMLCAVLTVCSGCGKKDPTTVKTGAALMGRWGNDDMGGIFTFSGNGRFELEADISSIMTIDGDGVAHLTEIDGDYSPYCSYDGSVFSFNIDGTDMLTMKRTSGSSPNNAYGNYILQSGIIYDQFAAEGHSADGNYYISAAPGKLAVQVVICDFVCDEETLILSGKGLATFTETDEKENNRFSYTVKDGQLTLTNDDETIVFYKKYV